MAPQHLSRRQFLKAAVGLTVGASLAGCSSGTDGTGTTGSAGKKVQLVYQDWRTEWFPPMAQKMLEEFHVSHPNIRVFYTPDPENLEEQMLTDMQAGGAPDVFQGCCAHFPTWAQKGYTLDLRPYVEADLDRSTIEEWDAAQYRSFFTRDGRQFGVPKYHGALALYYNKDLFDRAGVEYPQDGWDQDDYLEAMKALSRPAADGTGRVWGGMTDITWDRLQVHANAWGGHFVNPADPYKCDMGKPEALAALEWIRARMWDDKVMATFPDVGNVSTNEAFVAGKLAMVEDGSWALKNILEKAKFRVGVAPMPAGPARRVTLASTDGFGIYAGTRYPEAAWELVKFLISKQYGRAMASANLLQPARASLIEEWVGFVREQYPGKTRDMNIAVFADGHRRHYSVTAEIFPFNMATATRLADSAWSQIFTVGKASTDTLKSVAREIETAQTEAG